ncbi:ABC transporter ATP-binding protein [soil metagenome]
MNVRLPVPGGVLHAVRDVSLQVKAGQTLCLVGESGCGKSMTLLALMGLLPAAASVLAARMRFEAEDLQAKGVIEALRGRRIGMIFQDPLTAFNPTMTIGRQLEEVHLRHIGAGRPAARAKALELLRRVGIGSPESRLSQYPHELSGGLRQRAMIAMALMCDPKLLLADEPTTALDVTVQTQVLQLLKRLQREFGIAIVFVTHDLGVVAAMADQIAVMYAGQVVETGAVRDVFRRPAHPYTRALFSCVPAAHGAGSSADRLGSIPGRVPSLIGAIDGCAFKDRCSMAIDECAHGAIPVAPVGTGASARCIRLEPHLAEAREALATA